MANPDTSITPAARLHYDHATIAFHWLTALLVIALFGSAEIWKQLERGTWLRKDLQSVHISLGILLAVTIILRVIWRTVRRGDLPPATTGLQEIAARLVHVALYVLLCLQVILGFLFRWAQGEPFEFFGLFPIPHLFTVDPALRSTFGELHNLVGWTIIVVAALHAIAALIHHYVLNDHVLVRMRPAKRR
ncbi:cytochrome b [Phyllobacterium myrsinacearum]|uniref:Cytochrome b561 n=1 Tax=Phyllobacterium myrsinacearum TaxID=28101 RepID=A0A839EJR9_9HYPH|nr:cytochrome b [Phyllobacterium myrsinacearum]MBA8880653.1 cytochrome b561 [Phyllobacterium myrsinacearum]